ncbi:MAG: peptide deformylase [Tannerellaceae bacterium]|nr:peptide deformylase [Tannerellaceae bacterium]
MTSRILIYGSPVLRKHAEPISSNTELQHTVDQLFSILEKEEGIGLAAPQIGLSKRIFIIDTTPLKIDDPSVEIIRKVFINPVIKEYSPEKTDFNEGCLSIPGIYETVERPERIKVSYQDINMELVEKELTGIEARIFQHEFDHLEGILFTDRLSPMRKMLINGKLKKLQKYRR